MSRKRGLLPFFMNPKATRAKGTGKYSWVVILVVGAVGIAGILVLSKQEIRGMKDAGN